MDNVEFDPEYALSNFDIDDWMKKNYKNIQVPYIGTFSRDNIPKLKTSFATIVNLDEAGQPGSHWCCCYEDKTKDYAIYFDSYGLSVFKELLDIIRMKDKKRHILYNTGIIQPSNSLCGWLCCMILRELSLGKNYQDIILQFDPQPSQKNIDSVRKYFN